MKPAVHTSIDAVDCCCRAAPRHGTARHGMRSAKARDTPALTELSIYLFSTRCGCILLGGSTLAKAPTRRE